MMWTHLWPRALPSFCSVFYFFVWILPDSLAPATCIQNAQDLLHVLKMKRKTTNLGIVAFPSISNLCSLRNPCLKCTSTVNVVRSQNGLGQRTSQRAVKARLPSWELKTTKDANLEGLKEPVERIQKKTRIQSLSKILTWKASQFPHSKAKANRLIAAWQQQTLPATECHLHWYPTWHIVVSTLLQLYHESFAVFWSCWIVMFITCYFWYL